MRYRAQALSRYKIARNIWHYTDNDEFDELCQVLTPEESHKLDEYIEHSRIEPIRALVENLKFRYYGSASLAFLRNKAIKLGIKYVTRMTKRDLIDEINSTYRRRAERALRADVSSSEKGEDSRDTLSNDQETCKE